jgi:hypothetical protein
MGREPMADIGVGFGLEARVVIYKRVRSYAVNGGEVS